MKSTKLVANSNRDAFEEEVNRIIGDNEMVGTELVDIKFSTQFDNSRVFHSALLIFKEHS